MASLFIKFTGHHKKQRLFQTHKMTKWKPLKFNNDHTPCYIFSNKNEL